MKSERIGRRCGKLSRAVAGALLALGLAATAGAKTIDVLLPVTGLTVPTKKLFADSYSFTLGQSTTLDIDWTSKNLFLDVVLYKAGKPLTSIDQSLAASGSFVSSLGAGKYFLDFFGTRQTLGTKSNYSFSVLAVPEADTWAMLLMGGALVGYQLRRRHKLLPRQPISAA
jgi:hypothetical protein